MYQLKADGCVPFKITKEEYDQLAEIIISSRSETIKKDIQMLADTVGVEKTRHIVRDILHNL